MFVHYRIILTTCLRFLNNFVWYPFIFTHEQGETKGTERPLIEGLRSYQYYFPFLLVIDFLIH